MGEYNMDDETLLRAARLGADFSRIDPNRTDMYTPFAPGIYATTKKKQPGYGKEDFERFRQEGLLDMVRDPNSNRDNPKYKVIDVKIDSNGIATPVVENKKFKQKFISRDSLFSDRHQKLRDWNFKHLLNLHKR